MTMGTWLLGACAGIWMTGCGGIGGGNCSDTHPATFTGLLTTAVPTNASLSGSSTVTVALDGFQPDVEQSTAFCDSPDRYCGPSTFPAVIDSTCQVTFAVGSVVYDSHSCDFESGSASTTTSPQSCTLGTSGGSLSVAVHSGTLSATATSIQFTFTGPLSDGSGSATVMFQGS